MPDPTEPTILEGVGVREAPPLLDLLPAAEVPGVVLLLPTLPLTAAGKVWRRALADLVAGRRPNLPG